MVRGEENKDYTCALENAYKAWLGDQIRQRHPDWNYRASSPEKWTCAMMANALGFQVGGYFY